MESKNTFIKLNRKILDWEWYKDANTFKLFIHLLLTANVKDKKWQGIIVKRGELITSVKSLTQQTGLTTFQVRRALDNLITANTATKKTTNKYTVISILNYEKYQAYSKQDNKRTTNEQQTNNKRTTTTKEYKEYIKNDKKGVRKGKAPTDTPDEFVAPSLDEIKAYCLERKNKVSAEKFFNYYQANGWMVGNSPMDDWKAAVRYWEVDDNKKGEPKKTSFSNFEEGKSDYSDIEQKSLEKLLSRQKGETNGP